MQQPIDTRSGNVNTAMNMNEVRRKMIEINPADEGLGLMSPFLWPPPPKRHCEDSGSFLPSRPVTDQNRFKAYYIKFATKGLDPV